jgi:hypothetical protein
VDPIRPPSPLAIEMFPLDPEELEPVDSHMLPLVRAAPLPMRVSPEDSPASPVITVTVPD